VFKHAAAAKGARLLPGPALRTDLRPVLVHAAAGSTPPWPDALIGFSPRPGAAPHALAAALVPAHSVARLPPSPSSLPTLSSHQLLPAPSTPPPAGKAAGAPRAAPPALRLPSLLSKQRAAGAAAAAAPAPLPAPTAPAASGGAPKLRLPAIRTASATAAAAAAAAAAEAEAEAAAAAAAAGARPAASTGRAASASRELPRPGLRGLKLPGPLRPAGGLAGARLGPLAAPRLGAVEEEFDEEEGQEEGQEGGAVSSPELQLPKKRAAARGAAAAAGGGPGRAGCRCAGAGARRRIVWVHNLPAMRLHAQRLRPDPPLFAPCRPRQAAAPPRRRAAAGQPC
jgi:hypothetical protein